MEHNGKSPKDLTEPLAAIGITTPVVDPFSGELLRMKADKSRTVIYSVGFDGIDDHGKSVVKRRRRSNEFSHSFDGSAPPELPNGDIRFEVKF